MTIYGKGKETYLYINGIEVSRPVSLGDDKILLKAECSLKPDDMVNLAKSEIDLGVMAIFLRNVRSQLFIKAVNQKECAIKAWNSQWDAALIGALFDCDAICNFQCDKPAEEISDKDYFAITNYHFRGFCNELYKVKEEDALWLEKYYINAKKLLDKPQFCNAIHCLSSYRWHPHPRPRLALIWAGIEAIFNIHSELTFRISLYIAEFLSPDDRTRKKEIFKEVKNLYSKRSDAVHGEDLKEDRNESVRASARLLQDLVKKIIEEGYLPDCKNLVP